VALTVGALALAGCGSDGEQSIVEAIGAQTVTVQVPPSPQSTVPAAPQELPAAPAGEDTETEAAAGDGTSGDAASDPPAPDVDPAPVPGESSGSADGAASATQARPRPTVHVTRSTALRSGPGGRVIGRISPRTEFGSPTVLAVVRQSGPWLGVLTAELPNGRIGWISARARLEVHRNAWSVSASLGRREVVVRRAGRVVDRFPVAIGSPSSPTPTGRFAVTDKLKTGSEASVYGCCILALTGHQPHTPQGWGGGDRVAIHGTNLPQSVGTEASLGCLRAPASSIRRTVDTVPLGTIVTIRR
jgi:lipoprotein-anchoring transpeptidase ErfK/SrfK